MLNIKKIVTWKYAGAAGAFAASLAAGFLLSGTSVAGVASFADISLAGAVGLPQAAAVFTGSVIRSIIGGTVGRNIVKLTSLALIVIIKMFLEPKNDPKLCGINTAASVFASGAAVSAVIGELMYKLLFYGFYGLLAGFTSYAICSVMLGIKKQRVIELSGASGCACAVVYTILTASLCSVELPLLNPGAAAGAAVTLLAAYYYRHTGGVLCGALTVCGAFLASPSVGMSLVMLPAAGLLTGYLYKHSIKTAAAFFIGISFVLSLLTGLSSDSVSAMTDMLCAAVIFTAAAPRYSDKWIRTASGSTVALPEMLGTRMGFLSDTVEELRKESVRISEMLAVGTDKNREIEENSDIVCSRCYRKPFCWKSDRVSTYRGFLKLAEMTELAAESFPGELEDCLRKDELTEAFEKSSREKATAKLLEMRFSESRNLLHEQMKITEELIKYAGERTDIRYSEPVSRIVRDKLTKFGFSPQNVIAYYNNRNRLLVEIYFSAQDAPESSVRICDLVSDELRLPLESAEPADSGRELRIRLFEKPRYSLEVYGASLSAEKSGDNGDTSTVFTDGTGADYVILSDGMGSGKKAAVESGMVVRMFRRLVSSGVNYNSAVKLINSVMLTKSLEESFATLDAVRIDLDECELTVIKSGATATLIRHRGSVMKISSPTFPIGIYERSEVFSRSYDFEEGDIVIMFSDGICESAYRFIKELLLGGDDLKGIVDEICAKAEVFNPNVRPDDVTVIGIRVAG